MRKKNGKGGGQAPLAAPSSVGASLRGGRKRCVRTVLVLITENADHGDVRSTANAYSIGRGRSSSDLGLLEETAERQESGHADAEKGP
jgi:hypothetical protein